MPKINWLAISKIANGRVMRNVLFWLLFTWYHYTGSVQTVSNYLLLLPTLIISFGIPAYINNLYLIPLYLLRRKIIKYLLFFIPLFVITIAASYYITKLVNGWSPSVNYMGSVKDVAMIYHFFPTAFMFIIFAGGKFTHDAFTGQRRLENYEKEKLKSELTGLRSQLNPHFLFNALNTIYGLSRQNSRMTSQSVILLSDILRYVLYEGNVDKISLSKEIHFLEEYVEFQDLRQRKGTVIRLEKKIDNSEQEIAPLLLLPFVENAIKHGPGGKLDNAWVHIEITQSENKLQFNCSNNYLLNMQKEEDVKSGGIGLLNVKRRLELLYKNNHVLKIEDKDGVFSVSLTLDLAAH